MKVELKLRFRMADKIDQRPYLFMLTHRDVPRYVCACVCV